MVRTAKIQLNGLQLLFETKSTPLYILNLARITQIKTAT